MNNPIDYKILSHHNLFVARASGELLFDHLYQHVLEIMGDTDFRAGLNGVYDFSKVTKLSGDLEKWEALADGMSSDDVIIEPAKTAILLTNQYSEGIHGVMEQYMAMTAGSKINYQLFTQRQFDDAAYFLKFSEEQLALLLNKLNRPT